MPTMKKAEFEKLRLDFGMSKETLAKFLDVEARTIRRYASGESVVTVQVAMILRLIKVHGIDPAEAYRLATGGGELLADH